MLSLSDLGRISRRLEKLKTQFTWGTWYYDDEADEVECRFTHKTEGFDLKVVEEEGYPYLTFSQTINVRSDETHRQALRRLLTKTLERLDWEDSDG